MFFKATKTAHPSLSLAVTAICLVELAIAGKTLHFSGHSWTVRPSSGLRDPGPNHWDANNVWVDEHGWFHLKLTTRNGQWYAAAVSTEQEFRYGRYQFQIAGRLDQLDRNVVFGLFSYPENQPDGTNEIDIEFARWGEENWPAGSYTVWPVTLSSGKKTVYEFPVQLSGDHTTHSYTWKSREIVFSSNHGHQDRDDVQQLANWTFRPSDPERKISQTAMPVNIILWLMEGRAPVNVQEIELIVRRFMYSPF